MSCAKEREGRRARVRRLERVNFNIVKRKLVDCKSLVGTIEKVGDWERERNAGRIARFCVFIYGDGDIGIWGGWRYPASYAKTEMAGKPGTTL